MLIHNTALTMRGKRPNWLLGALIPTSYILGGYSKQKINLILKDNADKIHRVYDVLSDEKSKLVFESILRHRKEHNLALLNNICDESQYFGNDVINLPEKNFADCGAFTGDTLKRFLNNVSREYHYYAFEADEKNSDAIVTFCKQNNIMNVDVFNIAVCEKKQTLHFVKDLNDEKVAGRITNYSNEGGGACVQGDSLDNILCEKKIDMITMDIEGAEINALLGACQCIRNQHPKLAISAYHDIKHLWEIPILIHEICPEYHIYYRHHRWNMHDTVCYAIYEDKE